ncbi:COQ9 family protein [Sneathiella sp. P13V-1]|uniref:COQ9 family protein n=1 Tax=Sneathiella sp. P13V-1 TaxID=2697366 RepID=UPI00187B4D67|nr:COQ9 family protein [Sneathiella sp. P13V-1]MBE7638276.1 COQ9 family protein [Sneathiella sp. P13V-1]
MLSDQEQRQRLLDATLPHVMFDGWSAKAMKEAAKDLGEDYFTFERYFPGGPIDLISFFVEQADDKMEEELIKRDVLSMKIRDRITLAVRLRLEMYTPYREEIRKALTLLALPQNTAKGIKLTAETVSRMWYATGDTSTDYNYYTKRMTLSAVYSSTLLYWLDDHSENFEQTWEFLDRRIENAMQFETAKFKAKQFFSKKPAGPDIFSPARFMRHLRVR